MTLLRFLLRSSGKVTLVIMVTGALSSGFNAGLIAAVHRALTGDAGVTGAAAGVFLALLVGKLATGYASGYLLNHYSQSTINRLRTELVHKLLTVPYARLQEVGPARVLTALTEDLSRMHAALQGLSSMVVSGAIVVGACGYLLYLSPRMFAVACALGGIAVAVHIRLHRSGRRWFQRARELSDQLFERYHDITGGVRELKLNQARRQVFLERGLTSTTEALMQTRLRAQTRYLQSQATTQLMLFLGVFLLLLKTATEGHAADASRATATGYVLTALYVVGPLSGLLRSLPLFGMATIALEQLEAIGAALDAPDAEPEHTAEAPSAFDRIELAGVEFAHPDFALGPIDLQLSPGQITFVTGDNGSGKSTLALVLCGLYAPCAGQLRLDGKTIDASTRDRYRQLVSAVFFDFHPFDRLWRPEGDAPGPVADRWLSRLGLADKLHFEGDRPSTEKLSHGQRRRLALAMALLEDRPVIVFDEFGGDQSPEFKHWFYRELLPELRVQGKAVVVVTHDDRFFDAADQRLSLVQGQAVNAPAPTREKA